ncbi:ImmA/IrrE family metallo-endopeptidase [Spirosoma sp. KNUC1025]|uniref:ImmA/IrrE family metallo-endopeptidase n=1 Tax=Spirosoma sp. KNUC1025 TaxID=2894082 RepID=UPI001E4DFB90|nr:ImmA/IrrE family metallo-endopeptidase [Spirosoma sp. KNUC1025]UFH57563.1 ImmA/IrrE family metallo-endopeptidase [Spirosoma sp. KNUC1025]
MNHKRQKEIEQLAKNLLTETNCYSYPPIDVEEVARRKGIQIIRFDFGEEVSGVLITEKGTSIIGLNPENGHKRQRFTIAHELGHYILGHQRSGMFVDTPERYFTMFNFRNAASSTGELVQEREANAFAAALLMPLDLIQKVIDDLKDKIDIRSQTDESYEDDFLVKLANAFNVSTQAMGFRLSTLNKLW